MRVTAADDHDLAANSDDCVGKLREATGTCFAFATRESQCGAALQGIRTSKENEHV